MNYHTDETLVLMRCPKRRQEGTAMLDALVAKHSNEKVYVAWDNADAHPDDEVEAIVRGAVGRLVLLDLPTYSPWLNLIDMLWRQIRHEVTHCELFVSFKALIEASHDFFRRYNTQPQKSSRLLGPPPLSL